MTRNPPHIAIVGAGMAGLSCAAALAAAGVPVTVLEASTTVAGRMGTYRGDTWQCDHGAQYFTARDPAFRALVDRWLAAGVAAHWPEQVAILGDAELHRSNPRLERFVGVPRQTAPCEWLAQHLGGDARLVLGHRVIGLQPAGQGWRVETAEAGLLETCFDGVALAIPAPQAQSLLPASATSLNAIAGRACMRSAWALMLRFEQRVPLPFDGAFVNQGPLRWIARDCSKPGREGPETWLLHARAEWSDTHAGANADTVAAHLIDAFIALGGQAPSAWSAHHWPRADTDPPLGDGAAWDAELRLGLCGDWLNGGKVEGAWLSGFRLAEISLQALETGT